MGQRIALLMAVDASYAGPLCVTVESVLAHLRPGVGVDLHLMEDGIGTAMRRALVSAWGDRVVPHWVTMAPIEVAALRRYGYMSSPAANFRLLVGSRLPPEVTKVIYLDADLLVRKDLVEIWERDMGGKVVLAVQDSYVQTGPASGGYFNSGVMVIDLQAWRAARMEQACHEAAGRDHHRTRWLDQHVLNLCLAGRWGALPPVWNKQFAIDFFPDWRCSPYDELEFAEARRDPAILHFCSGTKPWQAVCDHSARDVDAYRAALTRTGWRGAFPDRGSAWQRIGAPHRRLLDTLAIAVRAKRRAYAMRAMLPAMLRLALRHPWTVVTVPLSIARAWVAMRLSRMGVAT